jgi:hypothetical protein
MTMLWRRRVLGAALSLTAAVGGLLVAGTAHAQPVATGSLSFSGNPGDYISQGKSYSYSTSKGDALDVTSSTGRVSVSVKAYNGDWWTLDFDAPGTPDRPVPGQSAVLAPGTYTQAHRYPFNGNGPGLNLSGDGRGCNELTGSFTVINAVFGPQGYVQAFDATFEQHCEGGNPAARGEIHISNSPPQGAPKRTTTASPRATATSSRATATSGPSGTAAGSGNIDANGTDANAPVTRAAVRTASRAPLLLIGVGALVILVAAGFFAFGIVMAVRRQ